MPDKHSTVGNASDKDMLLQAIVDQVAAMKTRDSLLCYRFLNLLAEMYISAAAVDVERDTRGRIVRMISAGGRPPSGRLGVIADFLGYPTGQYHESHRGLGMPVWRDRVLEQFDILLRQVISATPAFEQARKSGLWPPCAVFDDDIRLYEDLDERITADDYIQAWENMPFSCLVERLDRRTT